MNPNSHSKQTSNPYNMQNKALLKYKTDLIKESQQPNAQKNYINSNNYEKLENNTVTKKSLNSKKTEDKMKRVLVDLDEYLKKISQDTSLNQSNALYSFLCPTRELKSNSKKTISNDDKFSISSIFKG